MVARVVSALSKTACIRRAWLHYMSNSALAAVGPLQIKLAHTASHADTREDWCFHGCSARSSIILRARASTAAVSAMSLNASGVPCLPAAVEPGSQAPIRKHELSNSRNFQIASSTIGKAMSSRVQAACNCQFLPSSPPPIERKHLFFLLRRSVRVPLA